MSKRSADDDENVCQFFLKKKKRPCRMKTLSTFMKYCPHHSHLGSDHDEKKGPRVPCPLDTSHFCYESKLHQHLKKCNAREREKPAYFVPNINSGETRHCSSSKLSLCDVPDDELLRFIQRIKILFDKCEYPISAGNTNHELVQAEIDKLTDGVATLKHLKQQAALLGIMQDFNFLTAGSCFVEFGAGKGQLMYWIVKSVHEKKENTYILVDKSSQRHKSDNKLKDSDVQVERIKIDIQHLCLGGIENVRTNIQKVVGVCKHLCGAATDLSLKCLMETLHSDISGEKILYQPLGFVMALCCHHRCSWSEYVGQEFMVLNGLMEKDFNLMCSIASWATCGPRKQCKQDKEKDEEKSCEENAHDVSEVVKQPNRYLSLGLSHEQREEIGKQCKRLIDMGRIFYLENKGYKTQLVKYIDSSVSLENIALVGFYRK